MNSTMKTENSKNIENTVNTDLNTANTDNADTPGTTSNTEHSRGIGEFPAGRPPQTDFNAVFNNDLDYPRLGTVTFRRGSLSDNQLATFEKHWPELGAMLADEHLDVDKWFGRSGAPTIVEIGSGTGTSTAAMAPKEADTNIIAVELYKPGLAKLLGQVVRENIPNIRMIRVFFPDPWPKAKHHQRRIIQSGPLNLFASRLKPGGVLHVATDHADYAEWINELVEVEPQLEYKGWPWPECPQLTDRQLITKFEGKGLEKDHIINEYLWVKR